MTYNDFFHAYVMECVDFQLPNDELFSVENLCATCAHNFGDAINGDCYFWECINTVAHDDKGNGIICSCDGYEKMEV